MNAKKIMSAVLVALLAAALFVGAGAADDAKSVGTVFVYQKVAGLEGTWTGAEGSVTFVDHVVAGENIKAGVYTNESGYSMYLCYPTAVISAIANNNSVKYPVIGGNFYEGTEWLNVSIASPAGAMIDNLLITYPDGTQKKAWDVLGPLAMTYPTGILAETSTPETMANGTVSVVLNETIQDKLFADQTGTFKIQAIFNATFGAWGESPEKPLVDWIPDKYLVAQDAYTITVVSDEQEVAISASVDKVLKGNTFTATITGMPGEEYTLALEDDSGLNFISAGALTISDQGEFTMPNGGSITVYMNYTGTEDEITIIVKDEDAEVTIEILEPTLTATLGAASYFIGDEIEVTLTTDGELASSYKFNITGTNLDETTFPGSAVDKEKNVFKLNTASIKKDGTKKLDVGTYTIKIYSADGKDLLATLPVALKQPFISIIEAPEVIVQGTVAEFFINAESAERIAYYIFGTNYFTTGNVTSVKDVDNEFGVKLSKYDTDAKNMSTGQYFAVFQHPMYDKAFNIRGTSIGQIYLNTTGNALDSTNMPYSKSTMLFNVSDRQTANAAQALCDALDSQNIDDMYVKASFFVVGKDESFTISEIPTTIAQGETLTISGVSTANADGTVTVEMISTAFAAVPKETVGSAAFIAVSTKVADDGTWEITMDTSDLNVDEYSLKVAVTPVNGETETWKNVNINVVEAADKPDTPDTPDVPDTPDTPDTPTEPETPGFGALAALAGLGAVAVLLLRRE